MHHCTIIKYNDSPLSITNYVIWLENEINFPSFMMKNNQNKMRLEKITKSVQKHD